MPPRGTPAFDEATLNVSITEPDETAISLFHIQLKELEFKGTKAEQTKIWPRTVKRWQERHAIQRWGMGLIRPRSGLW